jgi:hypothetical protein
MPKKGDKKQFCKRGHEIAIVGRGDHGRGECLKCQEDRLKLEWKNLSSEAKKERGKIVNAWAKAHPEKRLDELLKRQYGISFQQYNFLIQQQGNKCAICKKVGPKLGETSDYNRRLSVDHDHKCCPAKKACEKCVRGLLCTKCNMFLGLIEDNILILKAAIEYLESYLNE